MAGDINGTRCTLVRLVAGILVAVLLAPAIPQAAGAAVWPKPGLVPTGPAPEMTVLPPGTPGYFPWLYYLEGRVNLASGNLYYTEEDLSVTSTGEDIREHRVIAYTDTPDPVRNLVLERAYNSGAAATDGPFGFGWTHAYNLFLEVLPDGDVAVHDGTGAVWRYDSAPGGFVAPAGMHDRVGPSFGGGYDWFRNDGSVRHFDASGELTGVTDASKNELAIEYVGGHLRRVRGFHELSLWFDTNAEGRIFRVSDDLGRRVDYAYDAAGNLVSSTDPIGGVRLYRYSGHVLVQAINREGVGLQVDYSGATAQQLDVFVHHTSTGTDSQVLRTQTIVYATGLAIIHGPRGGKTLIQMDDAGSPIKVVDALGGTTRYRYDADRNLVRFQDADGNARTYEYDARGNSVKVVDPLGHTITRTWSNTDTPYESLPTSFTNRRGYSGTILHDASGRPTELATPVGSIRYAYDAEGTLTAVTNTRGFTTHFATDHASRRQTLTDALGSTWTYTYDAAGRRLRDVDPRGAVTTYTYDGNARLVRRVDPLGGVWTNSYNAEGSLVTATDPLGRTSGKESNLLGRDFAQSDPRGATESFVYDAAGDLVERTDKGGSTWRFEYDLLNRLTRTVDPLGNAVESTYDRVGNVLSRTDAKGTTRYAYDKESRLAQLTDALGQIERYAYDAEGNRVTEVRKDGSVFTSAYDSLDRVAAITDPLGGVETFTYDGEGNRIRHVDENGGVTLREFDAGNRLTANTDPLGHRHTFAYDAVGNLLRYTDARGSSTTYTWTLLDKRATATDALGQVSTWTYDAVGNVLTARDPRGSVTAYSYDALNHLLAETDPLGHTTSYTYDARGNRISRTDRLGNFWTFSYDALDRLINQTNPLGQLDAYTYDAVGNLLTATDGNGHATTYAYDALGRRVQETDPLGAATTYAYDALDDLARLTDANGGVTTYTHDALRRLTSVRSPLGNVMTYAYDAVGNRVRRVDPDGRTTKYTYDAADRLTRVQYVGGGSVSYDYDPEGNPLKEVTVGGGAGTTATYTYDLLGRRISATRSYVVGPAPGFTRMLSSLYDAAGNVVTLLYPGGLTAYSYDAANRPTAITDTAAGAFTFTYDAEGRRTRMTAGNGDATTYAYDAAGRMTEVVNRDPSMAVMSFYRYTYDAVGNRLSKEAADGTTTYLYDAAGRLTRESRPGGVTTWTYDAVGNRLFQLSPVGGIGYVFDADNRLLSAGARTFTYDRGGNAVSQSDAGSVTLYSYDFENRLTRVALPDRRAVDYRYAGDGTRIERTLSGPGTKGPVNNRVFYAYRGDNLIEEWTPEASIARYLHGPNVDEPLAMKRGGVYYYAGDGLLSVTSLSNAAGVVVRSYAYDAWGNSLGGSGTLPNPFQYTAREFDSDTGLYYYRARTYTPAIGRFLQKDPLALAFPLVRSVDANLYLYVSDNPVNLVDPTGYSQHTVRGMELHGKEYWYDHYDEKSVREGAAIIDQGNSDAQALANGLNEQWARMQDLKHKIESAREKSYWDFFVKLAGLAVTIAGLVTANPFLAALGVSIGLHETVLNAAAGEDWGLDALKQAGDQVLEATEEKVGPALKAVGKGLGALGLIKDILDTADSLGDLASWDEAIQKARQANAKFAENAAKGGVFDQMIQVIIDLAVAKGLALAEKDKLTGQPVPTPGGGRREPDRPDGAPTPTLGGGSTGGVVAPDGGFVDVPTGIDPFSSVDIPVGVKNFGRTNLTGAVVHVRVYPEPAARRVLLVVDESDGANVWFEEALTDINVTFDEVFVDTEYTPKYVDRDPLTKDLKDYETVLWETSNDRTGTLELPAQPELGKYLDFGGCLFLGGDGFMAEWPAPKGTLMSDWMFADGYGGDTFDFSVDGVPGTIGDGLEPILEDGTGSGFHTFGTSLSGVKPPGEPAFLYNRSLAAVQGENTTLNGTYKSILASFEFASISERSLRDVLMERIIEFLTCQPVASGDTPVPTVPSTWDSPGSTTTVTTTVTLAPGNYVAVVTLTGGGDTYTPNNGARIPVTVKPNLVIDRCGVVDQPGNYTVTADLTSPDDCLVITADDVTILGSGHTISYGSSGSGTGIRVQDGDGDGVRNVDVADLVVLAAGGSTTGLAVVDGLAGNDMTDLELRGGNMGVLLVNSGGTTLTRLSVVGNSLGILVQAGHPPSGQPTLAYDNLFQNGQNAVDFTGFTRWNLLDPDCTRTNIIGGACRGGNAWSDYLGRDLNGDGIGDADLPYTANGGIAPGGDFMPLTNHGP